MYCDALGRSQLGLGIVRQRSNRFGGIARAVVSGRARVGQYPIRTAGQREGLFFLRHQFALGAIAAGRSLHAQRNLPELIVCGFELGPVGVVPSLAQRDAGGISAALRLHVEDWCARLLDPGGHDLVHRLLRGFSLNVPEVVCGCVRVLVFL